MAEIARRAREDETARRLMTVPGIGPLVATALAALAPPPEARERRDGSVGSKRNRLLCSAAGVF